MRIKYVILLLGICVNLEGFAAGHNVKEDLKKINGTYSAQKNYSMKVIYRLFPDYTSDATAEERVGIVKKEDHRFYASYFGIEEIEDGHTLSIVNHNLKTITISKGKKRDLPMVPDLGKSLKICSLIKYDSIDPEHGVYTFQFRNYQYSKVELEFNPATSLISRITMYYKNPSKVEGATKPGKPKMEILFTDMNLWPSFHPGDFSTSKFYKKQNSKKYILKSAYRNYRLMIG